MAGWRQVIGHDGYLRADLQLHAPAAGGRSRALQSGYRAQWWLMTGQEERWLGSGPLDLTDASSLKPGATGAIQIYPMYPPSWLGVGPGAVLHLRERVGQTLGVAVVVARVELPDEAPLRLEPALLGGNKAWLAARPTFWRRVRGVVRSRKRRAPP